MADWLAVCFRNEQQKVETLMAELKPQFAQMVIILVLNRGERLNQWQGWQIERGQVKPLESWRLIGPGMINVGQDANDAEASDRWSRVQGALGESTFQKVRSSKIGIVGCSRNGSLAAMQFASMGVSEIVLVDGDRIESHNLDGMVLNTTKEVGKPKSIALGRRLIRYRPDLLVKAIPHSLKSHEQEYCLTSCDLVVTCVDRDLARLRIAQWANRHLVTHLDLGSGVSLDTNGRKQLAGDIRLMLPGHGCVVCVGGLANQAEAEYEWNAPPEALPRRRESAWNSQGRLGSLITLNSWVVSSGVQSWLDLLNDNLAGSLWQRIRWVAGRGLETQSALVDRAAQCRVCRKNL